MGKTTKKDFKIFKKAVKQYCRHYKVTGWHTYFTHTESDVFLASVNADPSVMSVTFFLSKHWNDVKVTKKRLRTYAKHEVVHLILARLLNAGLDRFVSQREYLTIDEATTQHLTGLLPD